jgi:hypothetical protein
MQDNKKCLNDGPVRLPGQTVALPSRRPGHWRLGAGHRRGDDLKVVSVQVAEHDSVA